MKDMCVYDTRTVLAIQLSYAQLGTTVVHECLDTWWDLIRGFLLFLCERLAESCVVLLLWKPIFDILEFCVVDNDILVVVSSLEGGM